MNLNKKQFSLEEAWHLVRQEFPKGWSRKDKVHRLLAQNHEKYQFYETGSFGGGRRYFIAREGLIKFLTDIEDGTFS